MCKKNGLNINTKPKGPPALAFVVVGRRWVSIPAWDDGMPCCMASGVSTVQLGVGEFRIKFGFGIFISFKFYFPACGVHVSVYTMHTYVHTHDRLGCPKNLAER